MSNRNPVVYIVEDDPSFRKSVERLLKTSGLETVPLDSATAFLQLPEIRRPACLLLDVKLPDMDGLTLQETLIERGHNLPIVFMTGHGSIPMSVHAMKLGAEDFLPKPFDAEALRSAVIRAIERDAATTAKEVEASHARLLFSALTPREHEVLRWIIAGRLNKQIAFELGTTEKTIKVHRSRVMQKTRASSVADLVRLAEKANIRPAV